MKRIIFILFLSIGYLQNADSQTRYHVVPNANGSATGLSWSDAFPTLQDALSASTAGDTIWVKKGTYYPSFSDDKEEAFALKSEVVLLGGFAGIEALASQRNWGLHPTILDGDIGIVGDTSDNSNTILSGESWDEGTVIDGFIFQNGNANGIGGDAGARHRRGGAIFMFVQDFDFVFPTIRNCTFRKNFANNFGGAISIGGRSMSNVAPQFENCVFDENFALRGGGVFIGRGTIEERTSYFKKCSFVNNSSHGLGAGIFWNVLGGKMNLRLEELNFERNYSFMGAGSSFVLQGINIDKLDLYINKFNFLLSNEWELLMTIDASAVAGDSTIIKSINYRLDSNYTEKTDLGMGFRSTKLEVSNIFGSFCEGENSVTIGHYTMGPCLLDSFFVDGNNGTGNLSFGTVQNSTFLLKNSKFSGYEDFNFRYNSPFQDSSSFFGSNLLIVDNVNSSVSVTFPNSFHGINSLYNGTSPFLSSALMKSKRIEFKNNIFINSITTSLGDLPYQDVVLENNYIPDVNLNDFSSSVTLQGNLNNSIDPLFIDTATQNYHLHPCSPLINAGTNAPVLQQGLDTDLDGNPRILDGIVDIGPYESDYMLSQNGSPQITAACHGLPEGKILIAAEGGCPPYDLAWTKTDDGTMGTSTLDLYAGDYTLTVSDARGRTTEINASINGSSPAITIEGDSTACAFTPNAFLIANVANAETPINYLWNTGDMLAELENLDEGFFEVAIEDAFGCKDTASVEVTATPPVDASITIQHASSPSASDGALFFSVNSGFPPYTYEWSNGATTDTIINLSVGNYTVTVVDGNNCGYVYTYTVSFMVDIEMPEPTDAMNTVFPNPIAANSLINVRYASADAWYLMDAKGRVVARTTFANRGQNPLGNTIQMELPCLASGMYFWSFVRGGKSVSAGRLVVE